MEKNNFKNIIIIGLIVLVFSFIIVAASLLVSPSVNGIIVEREKIEGGYNLFIGSHNLALLTGLSITAIVLSVGLLFSALTYGINILFRTIEKDEKSLLGRIMLVISGIISLLLMAYFITMLVIFPVSLDKYNNYGWALSLGSIIFLAAIIFYVIMKLIDEFLSPSKQAPISVKIVTEGALMVAMSVILSVLGDLIPFINLPFGGGFSLSMLPIFLFALRRGMLPGFLVGLVYGIVNFLIDGTLWHIGSIFFDYLIPYSLLGLVAGIFSKKANQGLIIYSLIGVFLGGFTRYLSHSFSGMIFFGTWAPEGMTAFYYSFIAYNLPYMAANTLACLILIPILHRQLITKDSRVV